MINCDGFVVRRKQEAAERPVKEYVPKRLSDMNLFSQHDELSAPGGGQYNGASFSQYLKNNNKTSTTTNKASTTAHRASTTAHSAHGKTPECLSLSPLAFLPNFHRLRWLPR